MINQSTKNIIQIDLTDVVVQILNQQSDHFCASSDKKDKIIDLFYCSGIILC